MYEANYVYPALKAILQSRMRFDSGIDRLLTTCREHCPDPVWDSIAQYDYTGEANTFTSWYADNLAFNAPPDDVEVLWFAPQDIPKDLDLRGSSKWSRDPDDWQWFYRDDYAGPSYESRVVTDAYWLSDYEGLVPKRSSPANHPQEVVELLYSLGVYGLCAGELVRSVEASAILGNRSSRWIVVGHPDSVYGVILGKLTRSRWHTFHG